MADEGTPDAAADQGDEGNQQQGTPPDNGGNDSGWTPPKSQADLDRILDQRMSKERAKYGMTPDEAKQFKAQAEKFESESATEVEKREKAARKEAETAAAAQYRPMMAETAFRVAIGSQIPADQVDEFIADTNLTRFITDDGKVDTAKVLARVAQLTKSGDGKQQQVQTPRGPVIPGHQGNAAPVNNTTGALAYLKGRGIKVD